MQPLTGPDLDIRLEQLRLFLDRRIAELSAELHAGVQIADMNGERLSAQVAAVHARIAGLVALPAADARSSGVELEAVVQATEAAAGRILDAAEAIADCAARGAAGAIPGHVAEIFEACAFQDVTGQRIRRAIQHLQGAERLLEGMLPGLAPPVPEVRVATLAATVDAPGSADLAQAEVDRLLSG
jgi:chemotaxis protein CheZ